MKYKILWKHPSDEKPTVLENVKLSAELIKQLEEQYNDKIIAINIIH